MRFHLMRPGLEPCGERLSVRLCLHHLRKEILAQNMLISDRLESANSGRAGQPGTLRDHGSVGQPVAGDQTMITKAAWGTLTALVYVLGLGAPAEAQLAKQGTYTSHFGWYAMGRTYE